MLTQPGPCSYDSPPMKRAILLALLLGALPAAADEVTSQSMSGTPKAPKAPAKAASPAPAPKYTVTQQRIRELDLAKVKFMSAVGSCPKAEDCDPDSPRKNPELIEMIRKGEEAYMEACVQCATDKACDEERDRIRAGRGRMGQNVCSEQLLKQQGKDAKKDPAKKPAAAQPSK